MKKETEQLIDDYINGTCNEVERAIVERAYLRFTEKKVFPADDDIQLVELQAETFQLIRSRMESTTVKKINWRPYLAAASVILLLAIGVFSYQEYHTSVSATPVFAHDADPGGNKAWLTLGNGKKIAINDTVDGQLAEEQGVRIYRNSRGELIYEANGVGNRHLINTLETPRGGMSQVILPDGSHVWLNAETRLKYPLSFAGQKVRQIELEGEAYFEVAKDSAHPFRVKTAHQVVDVLGTHFNISAYATQGYTRTTLVEGRVQLSNEHNEVKLLPGDQATLTEEGSFAVAKIDTVYALAWKNGEFMFQNARLDNILRCVARWYDVDIRYEDEAARAEVFWGSISRYVKVSQFLSVLDRTGKVKFDIVDGEAGTGRKKIIVYKTN